jgi:hypothetical protein
MQEETSRALSGAQVGPWYAPNITSDPISGIGSWTQEDLVAYLRTGHLSRKAQAAGSMGEAVAKSFQDLTAADLDAIATYVKSVPAVHDPGDGASRFTVGKASPSSQRYADKTASGPITMPMPPVPSYLKAIALPAIRRRVKAARTATIRACS